jgi:hypothetical protein
MAALAAAWQDDGGDDVRVPGDDESSQRSDLCDESDAEGLGSEGSDDDQFAAADDDDDDNDDVIPSEMLDFLANLAAARRTGTDDDEEEDDGGDHEDESDEGEGDRGDKDEDVDPAAHGDAPLDPAPAAREQQAGAAVAMAAAVASIDAPAFKQCALLVCSADGRQQCAREGSRRCIHLRGTWELA